MKPSMYWKKYTRLEGEQLKDFALEMKKLTEQDTADLESYSREEMVTLGLEVDDSV